MDNIKIFTNEIDGKSQNQVYELGKIYPTEKIRIMPDVHLGVGSVIGFTCQLENDSKIVPNIVGVDIGCGVHAFKLGNIDIDLDKLDHFISNNIPNGFSVYQNAIEDYDLTELKCYNNLRKIPRLQQSLGTLGGGNHFIEIDVEDNGCKWLVIHSGSRNLGHQIATYYQNLAYTEMKQAQKDKIDKIIKEIPPLQREKEIKKIPKERISKETAYLVKEESKENYLHDMKIATHFAVMNRTYMALKILDFLGVSLTDEILSVHNYISEDNVIRKGAVSARENEMLLIPINMRDGTIIAKGKGNNDWNNSAPHGAGRLMGRREAKDNLSMEEFTNTMKNVHSSTVREETLDEAPMAYKSIESILNNIQDTCEIVSIMKPIYNFKGV